MVESDSTAPVETVRSRRQTHGFALFAAVVVAVAFGTALKVQLDLPIWFSSIFGVLVFLVGAIGHLAMVRGQRLQEVEAKAADMRLSLDRLTAPVVRGRRGVGMPQTPGEAASAAAALAPRETTTDDETTADAPAGGFAEPDRGADVTDRRAAAVARATRSSARSAAPVPGDRTAGDWAAGDRASSRAIQSFDPLDGPASASSAAATGATAVASPASADTIAAVAPSARDDQGAGQAAASSASRQSASRDMAARDMAARDMAARDMAARDMAALEDADSAPAGQREAIATDAHETRAPGNRQADAAVIQDFVTRLSRDGSPNEMHHDADDEAPARQDEAAISESVRALRATASTMRAADARADDADRGGRSAARTAHNEPLGLGADGEDDDFADEAEDGALAASAPPVDPRLGSLVNALRNDSIEVFLEPIVQLAEKTPRHFEVSARFRDEAGDAIDPHLDPYGLRGTGILPLLDLAKIARVADVARRLAERGKSGAIFTNIATETFEDDDFLNRFAEIYTNRMTFAEQLVVTLAQDEARTLSGTQLEMVEDMRELGFRFSLDHVTSLDMDFQALRAAGVGFIKLDAAIFLEGLATGDDQVVPAEDICRYLGDLGFEVIVEDIADEDALDQLVACGVALGRGDVFGGARPVKAEVFANRSTAAA